MVLPTIAEDYHFDTFVQIADAIIHEPSPELIKPFLDDDFPMEKLDEYIKSFSKPSDTPQFREEVKALINSNALAATRMYLLLYTILNSRILSPGFTNSFKLIKDMTLSEREEVLRGWKDSPLALKRRIFKLFYSLTIAIYLKLAPDIHNQAIGYPGKETRDELYENQQPFDFKYQMLETPKANGNELHLPNIDVVIVGSGSGAGVTAHTLTNEGYKVLLIEKGKYFPSNELNFDDHDGMKNLYEKGGSIASKTQEIFVLAGSTFGGGSTVNWSACLKTPFKVRKEWYDDFGIDWAADEIYDQCTDYVWNQMGASTDGITHSFANQTLLDGASKLGYKAKPVAQNNGQHPNHSCGFCYLGCKYGIKQGSVSCWLRDAATKGCQFMDQVQVEAIIHEKGKASGLLCKDVKSNVVFTITGPRKFVVSGGSLQTPILLQKSGFRNKHIGSNLKLHPVTVLLGDFGHENKTEPYKHPILTSVVTEVDDLDGKAHGAKIETILHAPYLEPVFIPWKSSDKLRQDLLRYNNLTSMLIITRDKGSGSVTFDPSRPDALVIDYSVSKYDRNALLQAILKCADILYIEGAKEIIHPHNWVDSFKSSKPKHERSINDKDFVKWRKIVASTPLDTFGTSYGSAHQMSSCRMSGKGPSYGAADERGRLFECKNVYVADASAMPTASGANPMISTMAIARYISLGIAKDLQPSVKL